MHLVEQHLIRKTDPRWAAIDAAALSSKHLYNAALYRVRQAFFHGEKRPSYARLAREMKATLEFRALPPKVAQWVLKQVDHDWQAFWAARQAYARNPAQFTAPPKLPHYKRENGRNLLTYTRQALSRVALRQNVLRPSGLPIAVRTRQINIQQVRIVPRKTHYVVEVVYERAIAMNPNLNPGWYAGVDVGLNNLAAVTSNQPGFRPLLINGRPLKSLNQFYHKRRAELQARLPATQKMSHRLDRLTDKRNRRIRHALHTASRRLIDQLVLAGVGTLVIGLNPDWKQALELGRRTNQNFVCVPHARFVEMLTYKGTLAGMRVIVREESYTSKCSFLDREPVEKRAVYAGRRVARGLFVAGDGRRINADVNGAYNIIRKEAPNAFGHGVEGVVVHPVRVQLVTAQA